MTGSGAENIALKTYYVPELPLILSVLQTLLLNSVTTMLVTLIL